MDSIVGALVGAFVGSIGATAVGHWLSSRRERREESELIVRNYLVQLQDAVESLWLRVENLGFRGGSKTEDASYITDSSLYVLSSFLAHKRRLILDGVYGHMEQLWPQSGSALEGALEEAEKAFGKSPGTGPDLARYHRRELADLCLAWTGDRWRVLGYLEFRAALREVTDLTGPSQAGRLLRELNSDRARLMMSKLETVGSLVVERTGIPLAFADRSAHLTNS